MIYILIFLLNHIIKFITKNLKANQVKSTYQNSKTGEKGILIGKHKGEQKCSKLGPWTPGNHVSWIQPKIWEVHGIGKW